jgi:hypothetical protein
LLQRVRDERDLEGAVAERGDRERDAADRDRALLHAVAEELRRGRDSHSRALLLRLDRVDAADPVDVALYVVSAERLAGAGRGLEVHLVPFGQSAERRAADRLGNGSHSELPAHDLRRRQAAAVDRDGVADGQSRRRGRGVDTEAPSAVGATDLSHPSPLSNDPGEHG